MSPPLKSPSSQTRLLGVGRTAFCWYLNWIAFLRPFLNFCRASEFPLSGLHLPASRQAGSAWEFRRNVFRVGVCGSQSRASQAAALVLQEGASVFAGCSWSYLCTHAVLRWSLDLETLPSPDGGRHSVVGAPPGSRLQADPSLTVWVVLGQLLILQKHFLGNTLHECL